jgi:ubiquinone/menaquinone biosynthesis C-methylase UbiE
MSRAFEASLKVRNAADYADFLLPHLDDDFHMLDVGCGRGTITLGLAERAAQVVGVDSSDEFADARRYAAEHQIENVEFRVGSVYALDFPVDCFDACLCHSMLETLDQPLDGLVEIKRTLKPGGVLGIACVEYSGLILAGPNDDVLRRFYAVRERVWQLENAADPYRGRQLRSLLERAGFNRVFATSKYISYGTDDAVASFGAARAEDCRRDGWYGRSARKHGLATANDLDAMSQAWLEWSKSPDAYLAFAWCRALGWKPNETSL